MRKQINLDSQPWLSPKSPRTTRLRLQDWTRDGNWEEGEMTLRGCAGLCRIVAASSWGEVSLGLLPHASLSSIEGEMKMNETFG